MDVVRGPTPSAAVQRLAAGFNDLGFALHRLLPDETNAFFSSLSIGAALMALLQGARGGTAAEIARVLGISETDQPTLAATAAELRLSLESRSVREEIWDEETRTFSSAGREAFRLSLATALFVQEAYPIHTDYLEALSDAYRADLCSVDFSDGDAAAARINAWVDERTEGRIRQLVKAEVLSEGTRLVLANAVYFKARWTSQFSEARTKPQPFHLLSGDQVPVPMMHRELYSTHWLDDAASGEALRLPYVQGLSMLVVLPAAGRFTEVERRLSADLLSDIGQRAEERLIALAMPRFELRSELELGEGLQALGMTTAFDERVADFSGITPTQEGLVLSEALHNAWIRVDERGTEAAAATALVALAGGADFEPPKPTPFVVDRPFFFFIQDEGSGAVLFMGRVMDPRS